MPNVKEIELIPRKEDLDGELSNEIYYECDFCGKRMPQKPDPRTLCERLSGEHYYCSFCLRNKFHTKNNRHILMLSFRSLIGYYYYKFYVHPITSMKKIYLSELEDIIKAHEQAGLQNPLFHYDPETFIWFIDFSRIGRNGKKIKLNDVLKTIINILVCFNVSDKFYDVKSHLLYKKYEEAIEKFYQSRYRPTGKIILVPTLAGCGITSFTETTKTWSVEGTREFTREELRLRIS